MVSLKLSYTVPIVCGSLLTCVVLIALRGFTQQLCNGRTYSLGAGAQILGTFLQLRKEKKKKELT